MSSSPGFTGAKGASGAVVHLRRAVSAIGITPRGTNRYTMASNIHTERFPIGGDEDAVLSTEELAFMDARNLIARLSDMRTAIALANALEKLPTQDRTAIMLLVAAAPAAYRDLFLAHVKWIDISYIDQPGQFNQTTGQIRFEVLLDRFDRRGTYFVFFHEVGHMIDWALMDGNQNTLFFTISGSFRDPLYNTLREDVENMLWSVANDIPVNWEPPGVRVLNLPFAMSINIGSVLDVATIYHHNRIRRAAINNILAGNRFDAIRGVDPTPEQEFQASLQTRMINILSGNTHPAHTAANMVIPSNIFGGITDNAVFGAHTHWIQNYWFDRHGNTTFYQNLEFFAHYFASVMVGNEQAQQNARDFFPSTMAVYDVMMDEILLRSGVN